MYFHFCSFSFFLFGLGECCPRPTIQAPGLQGMSAGACSLTKECNCWWKVAPLMDRIPAGALFSNKKWKWGGVNRELETYWPASFQWRLTPSHPPLIQTGQFYGPWAPSWGQIRHFRAPRPYSCELFGVFVCADEPKSAASACATFRRACNRVWAKGRTIILKVLFSSCALSLCASLVEVVVEVVCYLLVLYKSQPGFHENLNENLKSHGFVYGFL